MNLPNSLKNQYMYISDMRDLPGIKYFRNNENSIDAEMCVHLLFDPAEAISCHLAHPKFQTFSPSGPTMVGHWEDTNLEYIHNKIDFHYPGIFLTFAILSDISFFRHVLTIPFKFYRLKFHVSS